MAHQSIPPDEARVTVGVDTHADLHVVCVLDRRGRILGTSAFPTTTAGYTALEAWVVGFGAVDTFGIEGTGSWGAGLTRWLAARGHALVEVNRPNRSARRRSGKSDATDAEQAARAVQAGTATGRPKSADGPVEMLRTLRVARRSAVKARTQAANQIRALLVTAPDELRRRLAAPTLTKLVPLAAALRPASTLTIIDTTKLALRSLARRHQHLGEEIAALDVQITKLITHAAPHLLAVKGLGVHTASALLIAAGDNPDRLHSESAFAHLCGVAPLPASSGRTQRHRLNRGGDRAANHALYILAVTRMAWEPRTRAYAARRLGEGLTKPEIIRCLKRHIAREIYPLLQALHAP